MTDADAFDCFLSHNTRDKPAVRTLAAHLRARGVSVWLDEDELRPGLPWQPLLESGIRASRSVVVLVGADGLGPWEEEEMHAALTVAVKDGHPVIPVLLPDAPAVPKLPLFLASRTWVDLRAGARSGNLAPLDLLIWGITGQRPEGRSADSPFNLSPVTPPRAPPARVDEAGRRVSEIRGALFLARSLDELRRLRNRVKALADEFHSHPEVMDLADDVAQAIAAERQRPRRVRSWMQAGALSGLILLLVVGTWTWSRFQRVLPRPELVNRPVPGWIAEWKGEVSGLGDTGAAPASLRIRIGAAWSVIEVVRWDHMVCTMPVAVDVVDGHARLWTEGDISCPDGTRLGGLALICEPSAEGGADCTGRYAIDRPVRIALARVGGGPWPPPLEPKILSKPSTPSPPPGVGKKPGESTSLGGSRPDARVVPALPTIAEPRPNPSPPGGLAVSADQAPSSPRAPDLVSPTIPRTANTQSSITIHSPATGEVVKGSIRATGTLTISTGNKRPWILVRPTAEDNLECHYTTEQWYPQSEPRVDGYGQEKTWEAKLELGIGSDIGCKFEILAILLDINELQGMIVQARIDNYFRAVEKCAKERGDNCWRPIDLPEKLTAGVPVDIVTVMRGY